jgi:hypothetical protein
MFDNVLVKELDAAVHALRAADYTTASAQQLAEVLRVVQTSIDALTSVHARAFGVFDAAGAYEADGCSTGGAWLRRELRLTGAELRQRRLAAQAVAELDLVRAAADGGTVRAEHVALFGQGITQIGAQQMRQAQEVLLPVAQECEPKQLQVAIEHLQHALDPDAADLEWAKAQAKQDLTCVRSGHGWSVRGYLDADTGTKFRTLLDTFTRATPAATPAGSAAGGHDSAAAGGGDSTVGDDERPVARRRIEGVNTLLDAYLSSGLPSDKGIRPQLHVSVDHETLRLALRGNRTTPTSTPATLAGYGIIGRDLLARLACDSALTVLLTDTTTDHLRSTHRHDIQDQDTNPDHGCQSRPHSDSRSDAHSGAVSDGGGTAAVPSVGVGEPVLHRCGCPLTPYTHVLDVGRTERIATAKQRLAVLAAQQQRCAAPGCDNRHLEVHHLVPWLDGGPTTMNNLIGLCSSCHTLLHRGLIRATSDGHGAAVFTRHDGTVIRDVRRRAMASYAHQLHDHISATILKTQQRRLRPPPDPQDQPRRSPDDPPGWPKRDHPPGRPKRDHPPGRPPSSQPPVWRSPKEYKHRDAAEDDELGSSSVPPF